ncbi:hypothetical protein [Arenimonas daejeonensis]|uniref:hypothetical protein n=1 Tax=Arenimonas daejeonensis TaxID=370777 RepID=UPI0011BFD044|nr:hypothetical protein [Arenimonas daejeonensis]
MNRILLSACLVAATLPLPSASAQSPADTSLPVPTLLRFTDGAANALGIDLLRNMQLPEGQREIRLWVGFGTIAPETLLRFRTGIGGHTIGTLHLHARSTEESSDPEMRDWFRQQTEMYCVDYKIKDGEQACTVRFRSTPQWASILRNLEANDLEKLPDESELPETDFVVMDGSCLVVELLYGSRYRTYKYCNPIFRDEPEAVKASIIMNAVSDLYLKAAVENER